ncbi:hypothetical protein [Persicitalea jodogahamensis]|uniref:Lipoprotein n=1 Tax=Persicitalea jodogahamensis TaxID=402147 RepID=A0A8J3D9D1_9BACT|nr:hypothetical protein [Persicitalea jodogahamensis]GHB64266.1 hypothetical protein GCM10007390_17690 [Persicitalea jodogahamensis]
MKTLRLLLLLTLFSLLTDCRTLHTVATRADSTVYRSADSGEQWQREIIREYLPGQILYDTLWRYDTLHVPQIVRVPAPYPVREIIRESAARQQSQTEEKQVQTQTREKDAHMPVMMQAMMLLCASAVFVAIGMAAIILLKK